MILAVNMNYININFFLVKEKVNTPKVFVLKWRSLTAHCVP